jgi:hypothetical protein
MLYNSNGLKIWIQMNGHSKAKRHLDILLKYAWHLDYFWWRMRVEYTVTEYNARLDTHILTFLIVTNFNIHEAVLEIHWYSLHWHLTVSITVTPFLSRILYRTVFMFSCFTYFPYSFLKVWIHWFVVVCNLT